MNAVVLLSGGLDSAVSAHIGKLRLGNEGKLYALTLQYGQKHEREIDSAFGIGELLGVEEHEKLRVDVVASALTDEGRDIRTTGVEEGIPDTWVPQRNALFLVLAFAYAESVGAEVIYTGFNIVDYSGYPDCRPEFVKAINWALNLASKRFVETRRGIEISSPLSGLSKSQIISKALELGVPLELTWSCYQGREKACGLCDSCRLRLKGFEELGLKDPIEYEEIE